MFENARIGERLKKSFVMVATIASAAAVVGLIAMMFIASRYSNALINYGFSQGDIGKAMVTFSGMKSATRAIIGFEEQDLIDDMVAEHDEQAQKFQNYFQIVSETLTTDEEQEMYLTLSKELEDYYNLEAEIIKLGATEDQEKCIQAQERMISELEPLYADIYSQMVTLMDTNVTQGDYLSTVLSGFTKILAVAIVAVIVTAVVVSVKIGNNIAVGIAKPLGELGDRLKTFAQGDLATPFPTVSSKDEVADMIAEANVMADTLNTIIQDTGAVLGTMSQGDYTVQSNARDKYTGDFEKLLVAMRELRDQMTDTLHSIEDASSQVSAGSGNLAEASQSLAEGATDQAGAVEELQATITSITENIEKGAKTAEESYAQAQKYADEADNSRVEMQAMVSAMERINETSKRIENIISEIEDIASQTNLLSLNASIEAARAGEAGRGFAVVADQIRQLAEQSTQSAVDTRQLIEGAMQEIVEGNNAAERAAESIDEVVNGIKQIADASKQLSVISKDQAAAMHQAETGVNQISEVVQANSATAQESSATSEELSAQAVALDELIGKFVLK